MILRIRHFRYVQLGIALVALPLAFAPLSATPHMLSIELCSADGQVRKMNIPVEQDNGEEHCVKPCHACLSRKKAQKR